jgi:hypothetical protein
MGETSHNALSRTFNAALLSRGFAPLGVPGAPLPSLGKLFSDFFADG